LAFVNIVLISTFELEEDRFNEFGSLSLSMGKRRTSQLLGGLLIISALSIIIIAYYHPYFMHLEIIYLFSSLQLAIILLRPDWFVLAERYRIYADAIFFYPLIFLW